MKTRHRLITRLMALLLLASLALSCTIFGTPSQTEDASTDAALTFTEHTVKLDALWVMTGPPASGGTSPLEIRVKPAAETGELRVGFFEEEVEGTGNQWQASGWEAVILACFLTGKDPSDYEFAFSVGGRIDGPSAGGLMTVGVLAALLGETPRADATMTGTINPDGTIGPVGGIPHKIEGAAEEGKKLALVPIGSRFSLDLNQEKMVDVIEVGEDLGVEVHEVGNIFDAYEYLVGKPLWRPSASTATPEFPPEAFTKLKNSTQEWFTRYNRELSLYASLPDWVQDYLYYYPAAANEMILDADDHLGEGLVGLAYFEAFNAANTMRTANLIGNLLEKYNLSGFQGVFNYVMSTQTVDQEISSMVDQLQTQKVTTVSDALALFDAYSELSAAAGLVASANNQLNYLLDNYSAYTEDQLFDYLASIGQDYILASDYVQLTKDAMDFQLGYGVTPAPDPERILGMAEALRRAGEANLALFDATIIQEWASYYGVSNDQMEDWFWQNDSNYQNIYAMRAGMLGLQDAIGEGPDSAYFVFGNAQNIYAYSSVLLAKYYSLGAETDDNLQVVSFSNEKALTEMLDFADQRAKELINLCGEDIPISAIMYYENAHMYSRGDAEEQLTALNYYWQAIALAQAEAILSDRCCSE